MQMAEERLEKKKTCKSTPGKKQVWYVQETVIVELSMLYG